MRDVLHFFRGAQDVVRGPVHLLHQFVGTLHHGYRVAEHIRLFQQVSGALVLEDHELLLGCLLRAQQIRDRRVRHRFPVGPGCCQYLRDAGHGEHGLR